MVHKSYFFETECLFMMLPVNLGCVDFYEIYTK